MSKLIFKYTNAYWSSWVGDKELISLKYAFSILYLKTSFHKTVSKIKYEWWNLYIAYQQRSASKKSNHLCQSLLAIPWWFISLFFFYQSDDSYLIASVDFVMDKGWIVKKPTGPSPKICTLEGRHLDLSLNSYLNPWPNLGDVRNPWEKNPF